jgi:hypothetical protein
MMKTLTKRGLWTALVTVTLIGLASPSGSDEPDEVFELPAGVACEFALRVEIRGSSQVFREFFDEDGNLVGQFAAGRGSALTLINLDTGESLSLRANGSVSQVVFNPDGSQIWTTTGHNVLILFPTDIPAGPSTTLHIGAVEFTVDPFGVFTVQMVSGRSIDLCSELAA